MPLSCAAFVMCCHSVTLLLAERPGSTLTGICRDAQARTSTIGCQYAAWHPDSTYLAASSDSHNAVCVWRIRPKLPDALAAEPLGAAVAAALRDAPHLATLSASVSPAHEAVLEDEKLQVERLAVASAAYRQQINGADTKSVARQRLRVKEAAKALWRRMDTQPVCTYAGHARQCLTLAFVPCLQSTLVWLEAKNLIHIADVRGCRRAHRIVHAHTLPAQIALAQAGIDFSAHEVPAHALTGNDEAAASGVPDGGTPDGDVPMHRPPAGAAASTSQGAHSDGGPGSSSQHAQPGQHSEDGAGSQPPGRRQQMQSLMRYLLGKGRSTGALNTARKGPLDLFQAHPQIRGEEKAPREVDLLSALQLVLRAWHFANIKEPHQLYEQPLPAYEPFPQYDQLVGALWGAAADTRGLQRSEQAPAALVAFAHAVLQHEKCTLVAPSDEQEVAVAVRTTCPDCA